MVSLLLVFVSSWACCLALTPAVQCLARRYELVDRPDGRRKLQAAAVPLGGGLSLFLAALAGVLAALGSPLREQLAAHAPMVIGLGVAAPVPIRCAEAGKHGSPPRIAGLEHQAAGDRDEAHDRADREVDAARRDDGGHP